MIRYLIMNKDGKFWSSRVYGEWGGDGFSECGEVFSTSIEQVHEEIRLYSLENVEIVPVIINVE